MKKNLKIEDFKVSLTGLVYKGKNISIMVLPHRHDIGVDIMLQAKSGIVLDRVSLSRPTFYGDARQIRQHVIDAVNELVHSNAKN